MQRLPENPSITLSDIPLQELQMIQLVAEGIKDFAIARRFGVSVVTVRRRVNSFRSRVGAANRTQAIAIAAARGLIVPRPFGRELRTPEVLR